MAAALFLNYALVARQRVQLRLKRQDLRGKDCDELQDLLGRH
jgi:hypothetical protein